jgi:hypothetical protein
LELGTRRGVHKRRHVDNEGRIGSFPPWPSGLSPLGTRRGGYLGFEGTRTVSSNSQLLSAYAWCSPAYVVRAIAPRPRLTRESITLHRLPVALSWQCYSDHYMYTLGNLTDRSATVENLKTRPREYPIVIAFMDSNLACALQLTIVWQED